MSPRWKPYSFRWCKPAAPLKHAEIDERQTRADRVSAGVNQRPH